LEAPQDKVYQLAENVSHHHDQVVQSIHDLQEVDAAENVFVIIAHDPALLEKEASVPLFPNGILNNWKELDLVVKVRWTFLKDFAEEVEQGKVQGTEMRNEPIIKDD